MVGILEDKDRIFTNLYGFHDWTLDGAKNRGAWNATKDMLDLGRDWIINNVKASGLRGRGGAGFPTWRKWEAAVAAQSKHGDKYVVCNANEDEPGTFKDRDIIMFNPHALIEGMIIAGYAMGAKAGYNYIHGEIFSLYQRFEEALASYDKAVAIFPRLAEAWCNRGNSLRELKRFDEAMESYERAIAIRPDFADALSNRSMILHDYRRYDEALESCDRALKARPDHINALNNRAESLRDLKRFEEAMVSFKRLSELQPNHPHAFSGAASCAVNLCDWERRAEFTPTVEAHIRNKTSVISAFAQFGYTGDPALQRQCAANYVQHRLPEMPAPLWKGEMWRHDKPRIAYLSADFREHATSQLMAGLFEQHDRSRFHVSAFSFGTNDRTAMRARLVAAFDEFHDVYQSSDIEVAQMLRAHSHPLCGQFIKDLGRNALHQRRR